MRGSQRQLGLYNTRMCRGLVTHRHMEDHCTILHADVLASILSVVPASREQLLHLRGLRSVCRAFQAGVDACEHREDWTSPLTLRATEFCNDVDPGVTVEAPAALNMGIRRMLTTKAFTELRRGMHEFLPVETAQENMLACLALHLTLPTGFAASIEATDDVRDDQELATDAGMQRVVANAMRFHARNPQIQINGCILLRCLPDREPFDKTLGVYIVGTVAAVMRRHLAVFTLQEMCVQIVKHNVVGFDTYPSEEAHMMLPSLIVAGDTNVPMLIVEVLRHHAATAHWQFAYICVRTLQKYGDMLNRLSYDESTTEFAECMAGFVTGDAENVLLDILRVHTHEPRLLGATVNALASFVDADCEHMNHLQTGVQFAVNALRYHREKCFLMSDTIELIDIVLNGMAELEYDAEYIRDFQNAVTAMDIIPLFMSTLAGSDKEDSVHTCTTLLRVLDRICVGNLPCIALVRNAHVIEQIDTMFADVLDKPEDWEPSRRRLVDRMVV